MTTPQSSIPWTLNFPLLLTPNQHRCDVKADCDDESDEVDCQIVHLQRGYLKESVISALHSSQMPVFMILQDKPPPPLEAGSLVKILVNVDIQRILTLNEVDNNLAESI